jgi:hypothetical protein
MTSNFFSTRLKLFSEPTDSVRNFRSPNEGLSRSPESSPDKFYRSCPKGKNGIQSTPVQRRIKTIVKRAQFGGEKFLDYSKNDEPEFSPSNPNSVNKNGYQPFRNTNFLKMGLYPSAGIDVVAQNKAMLGTGGSGKWSSMMGSTIKGGDSTVGTSMMGITWGSSTLNMTVRTSIGSLAKKMKKEMLRDTIHHQSFTENLKFIDNNSSLLHNFEKRANVGQVLPKPEGTKDILALMYDDRRGSQLDFFPFHEMQDGIPKSLEFFQSKGCYMFIQCSKRKFPAKIICDDTETDFEYYIKFDKTTNPKDANVFPDLKNRQEKFWKRFSISHGEFVKKIGDSIEDNQIECPASNLQLRKLGDITGGSITDQTNTSKFGQTLGNTLNKTVNPYNPNPKARAKTLNKTLNGFGPVSPVKNIHPNESIAHNAKFVFENLDKPTVVDYQLAVRGNLVVDVEPPVKKPVVYRRKPSDDDIGSQKKKSGRTDDGSRNSRRGSIVSQSRAELTKTLGVPGMSRRGSGLGTPGSGRLS